MQRLSFSVRRCLVDPSSRVIPITGLVKLFQSPSQKVHSLNYRAKDTCKSEKIDGHTLFFRYSSSYAAGADEVYAGDRKSNSRKNNISFKHRHHDEFQSSSDHGNHSMRNDNHDNRQHYYYEEEDVHLPETQDTDELDDNFGNLSRDPKKTLPKWLQDEILGEPEDMEKPHRRLSATDRRHEQEWYFKQIEKFGKEGKVLEAIAVLDDWMLVRDRVMPNADIFTVVIGTIGRTGNAVLAFKYFDKMREYGLKPKDPTYTALFNACSNCPDKETALKKGKYLRTYMRRVGAIPNIITYNAIIKMYGRFGDLPNAFLVADEALSNRRPVDTFFFGGLLSAAISNKEEGLLYAIEVWRRMKIMKIKPDVFHYKLMLHAIAECKLGSEEQQKILLQPNVPYKQKKQIAGSTESTPHQSSSLISEHPQQRGDLETEGVQTLRIGTMTDITTQHSSEQPPEYSLPRCFSNLEQEKMKSQTSPQRKQKQKAKSQLAIHSETVSDISAVSLLSEEHGESSLSSIPVTKFPDLLNPRETFSEVVSFGNMLESKDRLLLMGGVKGFLRRMEAEEVHPDITVLTWLVQMARGKEDEGIILSALEKGKVKPDATFLNALIRSRSHQKPYDEAKAVLQLFSKYNVVPNRQTYGSLMYCTRHTNEAREVFDSMENAGIVPDVKTFGLLIGKGTGYFSNKKYLLRKMEKLNVKPSVHFLKIIEKHLETTRDKILQEQHQKNKKSKTRALEKDLQDFNEFYKQWLLRMKVSEETLQLENYEKKKASSSGRS